MLGRRSRRSSHSPKRANKSTRKHKALKATIAGIQTVVPNNSLTPDLLMRQKYQYNYWKRQLVNNPQIMGGETVFPNSRLTVRRIAALVNRGESTQAILEDYPNLTETDLKFASLYSKGQIRDRALQTL